MSNQEIAAYTASVAVNYNIGEFIDGQRDCRDGVAHFDGKGDSYDTGYAFEYQMEQARGQNGNN